MELEAKFRIEDDTIFPALLAMAALGPFQLHADPTPEDQHNSYFDTPDRRLRAARAGLRVRTVGARRIATLKYAATVRDGLFEREEWEAEVGPSDDPTTWPAGELRTRTLALLDGAALARTLTIRTLRRHIYAEHAGTRMAELSLDEGTIDVGAYTELFRELEIELLPGGVRADFDELVALLRAHFALVPEDRSKLARGLALLDTAS